MTENECSNAIIGAAIEVHRHLGPGLLESAYEMALAREFEIRGIHSARQIRLPVVYKGVKLDDAFRLDFLVEDLVVLEIKAVEKLMPIHAVQLLTYLRCANKQLGMLLNFHAITMKSGTRRVVNNM